MPGVQIDKLNGLKWDADDLQKKFAQANVCATLYQDDKLTKPIVERGLVWIRNAAYCMHGPVGDSVECRYPRTGDPFGEWTAGAIPYKRFIVENDRPSPCITNINDLESIYFTYNPERQWRRGFHGGNSYLFGPHMKKLNNQVWNTKVAYSILYPVHTHLDDAFKYLKENPKCLSRALNNLYWLIRSPEKGTLQLWRRRAFVGTFIGNKFFISDGAKILHDELMKELPVLKKYGYA